MTTVRDLGAPLDDILHVKRRIEKGEIPGPRLFVSGPFIQHKPYFEYEKFVRWGVDGPEDARAKVQKLVDAGRRLHQADRPGPDDGRRGRAPWSRRRRKGGKPVVAHAHREDEIRVGLKHGVDCFEHTGLATEPGYPEDILAGLRKRNATLYWCPTVEGLFLADYTARACSRTASTTRAGRPTSRRTSPPTSAARSQNVTALDYFTLTFRRLPTLGNKFRQLRETGVTMLVGTDSGIPGNFHTDSTWRELDTWVKLGATPMQAIAGATRWPARFLKKDKELGTLAPGRYADVIAVRGDVLANVALLQRVDVVVKNGVRVR